MNEVGTSGTSNGARVLLTVIVALAVTACDDAAPVTPDGGRDLTDAQAIEPDASMVEPDAAIADSGTPDGGAPAEVQIVHPFDSAAYEFPESVALYDGDAYVTLAVDGRIVRVEPDGTTTSFGSVPIPVPMSAFALGIAMGPDGAAYVALAKVDPTSAAIPGVYRIAPEGGAGTLFASHPMMTIPSDVDLDASGSLYITEAPTGIVFRVAPAGGVATIWLDDPLLDPAATATGPCGMRSSPFPIGANGIVVEASRVIVNNTETASIVSIPITAGGDAGTAATLVTDCALLAGTDGLSRDVEAGWLTTVQSTHGLVRIAEDGALTELARGAPLTSPAAVDVGDFGAPDTAVIANSAFGDLFAGRPTMPNLAVLDR